MIAQLEYTSISKVLGDLYSPGLEVWYGKLGLDEATKQRDKAMNFGTTIHNGIERMLQGHDVSHEDERTNFAIKSFKTWSDTYIKEWIGFEIFIKNETLRYRGKADGYAYLRDGRLAVIDFKTSKKIQDKHRLQIAAYYNSTNIEHPKLTPQDIETGVVVHLDHRDLIWEHEEVTELDDTFEAFKGALKFHRWRQEDAKRSQGR